MLYCKHVNPVATSQLTNEKRGNKHEKKSGFYNP